MSPTNPSVAPSHPFAQDRLRVVLARSEGAGSTAAAASAGDADGRFELLAALLSQGVAVTTTGEGAVAPLDDAAVLVLRPDLEPAEAKGDEVAAGELSAEASTELAGPAVRTLGIAGQGAGDVLARVERHGAGKRSGEWTPWFPVIDYDRCTNCMQCLSFCLFGVYDVDGEKQIDVAHPERCKTLCPACSRVCPEVAILFPKYKAGPINGAPVKAEDLKSEAMKVDISALLGG
ncbi:MAG: ferredoxin family protein, partial [Holophagales bacterium]|nr:ferredoxin family protein [Holophagales bacterium]